MSSELERRLEGMFSEAPEPEAGAGEEALHRALRALQPVAPARRGIRTAILVFAAGVVLLVIAAGSLAAAGALHVSIGAEKKPRPVATQLSLPKGADGVAAIVNGQLSVVSTSGFNLEGLPAGAATLSPHALFVAAGIGNSLVALAPTGRHAWSHTAGGRVVAISWAPDAIRIAYVVKHRRHLALHVIWGTGTHDRTIDDSVRAVKPSWRADSLELAYVGAGGRTIVYDLGHRSRHVVAVPSPVTNVAFAPVGDALAVEGTGGVWVANGSRASHVPGTVEAFGWLGSRLAVASPGLDAARIRLFTPEGDRRGAYEVNGIVAAITPKVVVVRRGQRLLAGHATLMTLPNGSTLHEFATATAAR